MQMPELMQEEAISLFVNSSVAKLRNDVDKELILRCVKRCYFQKEDDTKSCHHHPLALDVLGRQLSRLTDLGEWVMLLDRIDEDVFNQSREKNHPIFSILRKSFDALSSGDQMLFMDVALYLPNNDVNFCKDVDYSVFKWLGMVHNFQRVDDVIRALERLRAKSLLEKVGDGVKEHIGMHDLWRAFCVAETQGGEIGRRRWMYEARNYSSELVEASPSGSCWENMKRMAFLGTDDPRSLEKVDFGHFANVTVLKISMERRKAKKFVINLSGLIHLKSLEVWGFEMCEGFVIQGRRLPDMRSMVSLRVAKFYTSENAVTSAGLSSNLTNLRLLDLHDCKQLRSCPGVGDLVALEELTCSGCEKLERLPSLRKLRNLRKFDISGCGLITELPGLGDLVALEKLRASVIGHHFGARLKLPDLRKLKHLRVLDLDGRRLQAAPGLDSLISLQKLVADFREVLDGPNLRQLTKLQELSIRGCSLAELRTTDDLAMLHTLNVEDCKGVDDLPDFQGPTSLRKLTLRDCELKSATSLSELSTLEEIELWGCRQLEVLPDLQGLTRLESLQIADCDMLRGWDSAVGRGEESSCKRQDSNTSQLDRRDFQRLIGLRSLDLYSCSNLADLTGIGAFRQLESLFLWQLPVRELPDLSNFPHLNHLDLWGCDFLTRLTCSEPVHGLVNLVISGCNGVEAVPDLGIMFPALEWLSLEGCSGLVSLTSSEPMTRMILLHVRGCRGVSLGDVDQLRASCPPQCDVSFVPVVEEVVPDSERMQVRRLFKGCFGGLVCCYLCSQY